MIREDNMSACYHITQLVFIRIYLFSIESRSRLPMSLIFNCSFL